MNLPAILAVLGLACYSALFYVVVSSPVHTRGRVRRLFLGSLVVMVAWQVSALVVSFAHNERLAIAGYQAMTAVVVVFGVFYALFVRTFLMMGDNRRLTVIGGLLSITTSALVIAARRSIISSVYWNTTTQFYLPTFGPLAAVVGVPYYVLLGYVVYLLLRGYQRAHQPLIRSRIQYLLVGWCLVLLGTLANFVPALKDYPVDLMANVLNAVLITYTIFRYQLLDISLVIRKGLVYSIPTAFIAVTYFLILFAVERLLAFVGYQVFLLSVIVAVITAVAVQPLRDRAQFWVDRLFFREKYDVQLMLQQLSGLATAILDIDKLTTVLLERLTTTMHVKLACIMLKDDSAQFRLVAQMGKGEPEHQVVFRKDHPVVQWMARYRKPLTRYDIDVIPEFRALWVQEREELNALDAQLFVSLVARGELIGILVLGPKLSETLYSQDEQLTLTTLANQVAIAIENARLFGEAQEEISERKRAEGMLRRRTARLELLREIDEEILESRPPDKTIEAALRRVRELLGCEGAGLITLDGARFSGASSASDDGEEVVQAAKERGRAAPWSLQEAGIHVVDDLDAVGQPLPELQELRELGHRSVMLVPVLLRQPQLVDTLVLAANRPAAFGEEEQAVGREIAHSLALAIRHTEMRREIRERAQALEQQLARVNLFNEITRAIAARHDLDSILRAVSQRLEDNFTDLASVWLGDGKTFAVAANGDRSRNVLMETNLPPEITIPSEVVERYGLSQGRLMYVADLMAFGVQEAQGIAQRFDMGSTVVAPLVVEDTVFGVIVSVRRGRDAFSRAERDFLSGLGEHVALAIHQARLHEDVETAYNELRETQRAVMQQERLRALGEMASGIAHDINNAISPIPLYAGLIENRTKLDELTKGYLNTIKTAVKDVEETVGRMRQFYRRREEEDLFPVDVNPAVQQAIELTRPRWRDVPQEQGITIDLQTDFQDGLPLVMGNDGEIRQAVTNLILNAVDAMPQGGTLTVRTRDGFDPSSYALSHVILEVIDTGIGMADEILERAFEPFFSTKGARGSGMGLATVYGTMQRHGGDVQADSALGKGTTMRLIFPVRQVVEENAVEAAPAPLPPLRILCVDDEPLVREAMKDALEAEGHTVAVADGGQSGVATFRAAREQREPFDVVITDLGMPYVDGRKVARTVKEEAPETPVILLTGWGQRLQAENEVPADVDLLLSKPPSIDSLNRALARVLSREKDSA